MSSKFDLFDSLQARESPLDKPEGGTMYLYKWQDPKRERDWRADGYRWKQSGSFRGMSCNNGNMARCYFHVSKTVSCIS